MSDLRKEREEEAKKRSLSPPPIRKSTSPSQHGPPQQQHVHPSAPQQFVYIPGQSVPLIPSSNGGFIQQIRPQDNPNVYAQFIPVNYIQGQQAPQNLMSNYPVKYMPGMQFYQNPVQLVPQQIVCLPNPNQMVQLQVSSNDSPSRLMNSSASKESSHMNTPPNQESFQNNDSTEETDEEEEEDAENERTKMHTLQSSASYKYPLSDRSSNNMAAAEAEAVEAMLTSPHLPGNEMAHDPKSTENNPSTASFSPALKDTSQPNKNNSKKRRLEESQAVDEKETTKTSKSVGSVKSITEEDESGRSADELIYAQIYGEPLKSECIRCQNEFLYPRGHEKVRCPHCSEVVEVPTPQETEESKKIRAF
jgi:hypothetical protein